jgi:hypothetical protein
MAFVMRAHSLITMLKHHAGCKGKRSKYIFTSPELSDAAPKSGQAIMRVQQTERHIRSSASSKHCCCLSSSSSLELLRCHPTEGIGSHRVNSIAPPLTYPPTYQFPFPTKHTSKAIKRKPLVSSRPFRWLAGCLPISLGRGTKQPGGLQSRQPTVEFSRRTLASVRIFGEPQLQRVRGWTSLTEASCQPHSTGCWGQSAPLKRGLGQPEKHGPSVPGSNSPFSILSPPTDHHCEFPLHHQSLNHTGVSCSQQHPTTTSPRTDLEQVEASVCCLEVVVDDL